MKAIREKIARARRRARRRIHKIREGLADRLEEIRSHRPGPRVMFDSIDLGEIPKDAKAVAGYVNGAWPTYRELADKFPKARKLSIAVTSKADAECLDVEPGNATPADAPAWVKRQLERGVNRPVVYCAVSAAGAVLAELRKAGIERDRIRLWTAHYTHKPHRCSSSCGFGTFQADATQWTDHSGGRNLDESLLSRSFLA